MAWARWWCSHRSSLRISLLPLSQFAGERCPHRQELLVVVLVYFFARIDAEVVQFVRALPLIPHHHFVAFHTSHPRISIAPENGSTPRLFPGQRFAGSQRKITAAAKVAVGKR